MDTPLALLATVGVLWLVAYMGNRWIDRAEQRRIERRAPPADASAPSEWWHSSAGNYHPELDPNRDQERRR